MRPGQSASGTGFSLPASRPSVSRACGSAGRTTASAFGAKSIREAVTIEANISRQAAELSDLEAAQRPTLTGILGKDGLVAYSGARALLISSVGIMMCAASGALLRARRSVIDAPIAHDTVAPQPISAATKAPMLLAGGGRYANAVLAPIAVSLAGPALSAPVPVISVPAAIAPFPSAGKSRQGSLKATASGGTSKRKMKRASMQDSGVGEDDGARFVRVRTAILQGEIKPTQAGRRPLPTHSGHSHTHPLNVCFQDTSVA
jgi:hypothetical protein